jgi:hypothetical protein
MKTTLCKLPLLLVPLWLGCEPNVVNAVLEPPEMPDAGMAEAGTPNAGMPDPDPDPVDPLQTSLIHRYSFSGTGTAVLDSKGAAHGEVMGAELDGDGTLTLLGERSGQYVNLPNGLISGLTSATFEAWLTWQGGAAWQRIFDFGSGSSGEDVQGTVGISYLFLTTASDPARMPPSALRAAFSTNGVDDEEPCHGPAVFPSMALTHVALVVDPALQTMALYQDGAHLVTCTLLRPLSLINDVNNWLGRSNYVADVDLSGSYEEFRIYGAALSAEQLADSYAAGPDAGR